MKMGMKGAKVVVPEDVPENWKRAVAASGRPLALDAAEEVRSNGHRGYLFEDGVMSVYIPDDHINSHTYPIFADYLPRAMQLFAAKNSAYVGKDGRNASERFGVVAQYMKMVGKLDKLENPLFHEQGKGPELEFEGVEEVLFDLIGHALETIYLYHEGRENKG